MDQVLDPPSAFQMHLAYSISQPQDVYGNFPPLNLAFLHHDVEENPSLFIEDWKTFYCPAQPANPANSTIKSSKVWAEAYRNDMPWRDQFVAWSGRSVTTSYTYNPNVSPETGKSRYRELGEFPPEAILCLDVLLCTEDFIAHWIGAPSWNTVYADGHVRNIASHRVEAKIEEYGGSHDNLDNFCQVINTMTLYGQ